MSCFSVLLCGSWEVESGSRRPVYHQRWCRYRDEGSWHSSLHSHVLPNLKENAILTRTHAGESAGWTKSHWQVVTGFLKTEQLSEGERFTMSEEMLFTAALHSPYFTRFNVIGHWVIMQLFQWGFSISTRKVFPQRVSSDTTLRPNWKGIVLRSVELQIKVVIKGVCKSISSSPLLILILTDTNIEIILMYSTLNIMNPH